MMITNEKPLKYGVKLLTNDTYVDDRGQIAEIVREDELLKLYPEQKPDIKQVYMAKNPKAGTIRAFHKHDGLWDYFHIINGSAKFITFPKGEAPQVTILSDKKMQTLVIPPGVFHGWISLEDNTILVSTCTPEYNHSKPDEERIAWDTHGKEIWGVQFK
jgi:dTDP-4-dehydrorhamnose 3,5-epimerase-like enzyme